MLSEFVREYVNACGCFVDCHLHIHSNFPFSLSLTLHHANSADVHRVNIIVSQKQTVFRETKYGKKKTLKEIILLFG